MTSGVPGRAPGDPGTDQSSTVRGRVMGVGRILWLKAKAPQWSKPERINALSMDYFGFRYSFAALASEDLGKSLVMDRSRCLASWLLGWIFRRLRASLSLAEGTSSSCGCLSRKELKSSPAFAQFSCA